MGASSGSLISYLNDLIAADWKVDWKVRAPAEADWHALPQGCFLRNSVFPIADHTQNIETRPIIWEHLNF